MPTTTTQLPHRSGPRPATGPAIPHEQLDQIAPPDVQQELWRRMAALDGVHVGRSHVSIPATRALHLDPATAQGPVEAFMAGHEFAHLHGAHDGSLHLTLPRRLAAAAIAASWAEPHPLARAGVLAPTLVMVYGPRDQAELETVWQLVEASYAFARGGVASPA
jgi:hypothetical protein